MAGNMTWHKDGIYSKTRTDPDGTPYEQFFVRVWVPSEKRSRVFKAGRTITSAKRKRDEVRGDPEAAVKKRQQAVEIARPMASTGINSGLGYEPTKEIPSVEIASG